MPELIRVVPPQKHLSPRLSRAFREDPSTARLYEGLSYYGRHNILGIAVARILTRQEAWEFDRVLHEVLDGD